MTGILSDDEIQTLVERTLAHGGHVSYKTNSDGSQSPYEMNITYFDAINSPELTASSPERAVQRFLVSQAIQLSLAADGLTAQVFGGYLDLLAKRNANAALHPLASQTILDLGPQVFAVMRQSIDGKQIVLAVHNVTDRETVVSIPPQVVARAVTWSRSGHEIVLGPYAYLWIDMATHKHPG